MFYRLHSMCGAVSVSQASPRLRIDRTIVIWRDCSVCRVRVSCPSIASVCRVSVSHLCVVSVPTFETSNPSVLLHSRPILTGWKLLPQPPRASMSLVVSLVMSLVVSLVMSLVVSIVMSLVVWGGCDSMIILRERDRRPFLHQS